MNVWDEWVKSVGAVPPLGYLLRERLPRRWLRIHSLPGAKRLPKSEHDMDEVLHRMNTVACAVLGVGAECVVFEAGDGPNRPRSTPDWKIGRTRKQDLAEAGLTFSYEAITWVPGALDKRLRERAMDNCWPFAVFSRATRGVLIPYDGGADVFVHAPSFVASMKGLFQAWLPPETHGF